MRKGFWLIILSVVAWGQSRKDPCETLTRLNRMIQYTHYKVKPVDDSLSAYVFREFLSKLDEDNRIFLGKEVDKLAKNEYTIDNAILQNDCSFLTDIYETYSKAVERRERLVTELEKEPVSFSSKDSIFFSNKNYPYPESESQLKYYMRKSFLFQTLRDVAEISTNLDSLTQHFDTLANESRQKIFESQHCKTSGYTLTYQEFCELFYNVFCSYFDPHTNYFSQSDRSAFLSSVSADNYTFGLYVSLNGDDEIVVDNVIPGSPAYQTKKIDSGDIITKVKYNGAEYTVGCASMKHFEEVFASDKHKKADFTLRKKTGEIVSVKLTKKIMKDYENSVYSYVLKKDSLKIGYIKIPSFYSNIENGTTNVSDDVARELYKLKTDKIAGLVIDLEDNGGGSMEEAKRLTGMFVDIGPIAVMNNSSGGKEIVKDYNRGMAYNGPLVVMINGFSASASEFFTNALQDYNRAVVIGTVSHGKASMQRIFPLFEEKNPEEFIKITIEEFYRITGNTNQTVGITPQVHIPLLFDKQMPREKDNKTALANDSIPAKLKFDKSPADLTTAIEKSMKRVNENPVFAVVTKLNERINALYDTDLPPVKLDFQHVFNEVNRVNGFWKEILDFTQKEYDIQVENSLMDKQYNNFDEYVKSSNEEKIKAIRQNLRILEAINIINDLQK